LKIETIVFLLNEFEHKVNKTEEIEFWLARDIQQLLGYAQWRNFVLVIDWAKSACINSGQTIDDHFADVSKMVDIGSGAAQEMLFQVKMGNKEIQSVKKLKQKD